MVRQAGSEFAILLRLHLRLLGRKGGTGKGGPPEGGVGRLLLRPGALVFAGAAVAFGLGSFLSGAVSGPQGQSLLTPLLELASTWGMLLLFFFALPLVLGGFTASSDLKLLLLTPLPPRLILAEKFLELYATLALAPLVAGLLILLAIGGGLNLGPAYYAAAVIVLLLLPLAPLTLAITLLVAVLRWIPPARARTITAVFGAMLGIAYYLGIELLSGRSGSSRSATLQISLTHSSHAWWQSLPTSWPGEGLAAAGLGQAGTALTYLVVTAALGLLLATLAISVSAHLFETGWATYQEVGRRGHAPSSDRTGSPQSEQARLRGESGPIAAPAPLLEGARAAGLPTRALGPSRRPAWWPLLRKEWRTVRRDPQLWAPLLYPLFIVGFGFYRAISRGFSTGSAGGLFASGWLYGSLAFLAAFLAAFMALSSVNREGKMLYLLALMPLDAREILLGKWASCVLPILALVELLGIAGAIFLGIPAWEAILAACALAALVVALCGVLLLITLVYPRLDWDNPRRQVSTTASLLGMVTGFALAGIVVGLLLLTFHLGPQAPLTAAFVGLCLFALTAVAGSIAAARAPVRLQRLLTGEAS